MRILFIDPTHSSLIKGLEKENHICDTAYIKTREEILSCICNYQGIVLRSRISIDYDFLSGCKNLKFIARAGSGLENIDLDEANKRDIKCLNAPEGNRQAVAEHSLGLLLSLFNNLNNSDKEVRRGIWEREGNRGIELSGKTIGIIGYGNNGSAFAELLSGFNVKILTYDKYLKNYSFKSNMRTIFNEADILSLHVPLTDETHYLVNDAFLNKFRKPIYIINTARGKCLFTKALVTAMESGKVIGACLDVLEYEKNSFEEVLYNESSKDIQYLIDSNKTILTPHIAGWTHQSNIKIAKILLNKIIAIS